MYQILNCKSRLSIGDKFNRYTVIGAPFKMPCGKRRRVYVVCQCECGKVCAVSADNLTTDAAMSCGCLMVERSAESHRHHGYASRGKTHPLYTIWQGIKNRCYQKCNRNFKHYGGRGITVSDEWKENPAAFIEWALASGWTRGLEVDRRDNDSGYSSSNCRIVTKRVNQQNKRSRNWR